MISAMKTFSERITAHLESIGWKPYTIVKWFKGLPKKQRLSEQYVYKICNGVAKPKNEETIKKLSEVEGLGLSYKELKAWYLLEHNEKEELRAANELIEREDAGK